MVWFDICGVLVCSRAHLAVALRSVQSVTRGVIVSLQFFQPPHEGRLRHALTARLRAARQVVLRVTARVQLARVALGVDVELHREAFAGVVVPRALEEALHLVGQRLHPHVLTTFTEDPETLDLQVLLLAVHEKAERLRDRHLVGVVVVHLLPAEEVVDLDPHLAGLGQPVQIVAEHAVHRDLRHLLLNDLVLLVDHAQLVRHLTDDPLARRLALALHLGQVPLRRLVVRVLSRLLPVQILLHLLLLLLLIVLPVQIPLIVQFVVVVLKDAHDRCDV